ncbi:hypothetical protein [Aldersonia kunmingensis]|uniref:hypothetical protein n=1 Tax=Aldersonia kunmingensis TaxID=408066 RepID=UPI000829DD99|nr:hypothetical protein [Aldersonia kunmingensis]
MSIRTIGPNMIGSAAFVILGLAAGAAVVGIPAANDATTTSVSTPAVVAPAQPVGHDEICTGLRARHDLAIRSYPSDAAQARIAAQSMLDLHC